MSSPYDLCFPDDELLPSPPLLPTQETPPPKDEIIVDEFAYSIDNIIGHGNFALVFKGRYLPENKAVAIKVISIGHFKRKDPKSDLIKGEELMQLNHANIIRLYGFRETESQLYLFIEYANQKDLDVYLKRLGTLSESTIKFYLKQISEAMNYLYDKGFVHRELKPENILLHANVKDPVPLEMIVKISNFSVKQAIEADGTAIEIPSTDYPFYSSPEVHLGLPSNYKADLWSIGAVAYTCFTGEAPIKEVEGFDILTLIHETKRIILDRPLGMSDNFWNLLSGLLQPDPANRMSFESFYGHVFMCNTPSIPIPRKRDSKSSDYSYSSCDQFSPVFSHLDDFEEKKNETEQRVHEDGAPGVLEGAKYAEDSDDLQFEDFVIVPITDSASGLVIDPYYDPVHEVILPCVRRPKSDASSSKRTS